MKLFKLYFNTIVYLKPVQILYRLRFLKFIIKNYAQVYPIRNTNQKWRVKKNSLKIVDSNLNFRFLNETGNLKELGWHSTKSKLWNYNLNYFDFLTSQKTDFYFSKKLIFDWICKNPNGKEVGNEPYPTSLRLVNWIKWSLTYFFYDKKFLRSLTNQAYNLYNNIEYHLLGNHLLKNAKALIFYGIFIESAFSQKCFNKGRKIFLKQIDEQILNDGAHFEQSPMYHAIIMEDCLDILHLFKIFNQHKKALKIKILEKKIISKLEKMSFWYDSILHPDNDIPFINDSCFNIAPKKDYLLYYFKLLNLNYSKRSKKNFNHFKSSGFCVYKSKNIFTIIDCSDVKASYIPGHSHADTLSFETSFFNRRCIVNSGISTYENNRLRLFQRGTKSHNTLYIDGHDSSQIWKSFRLGKRANITNLKIFKYKEYIKVFSQHDGYSSLGNIVHSRYWYFRNNSILIKDILNSNLSAKSNFYIHPIIKIKQISLKELNLIFPSGEKVKVIVSSGNLKIEESNWYPEFGLSLANNLLSIDLVDNISEIKFQL